MTQRIALALIGLVTISLVGCNNSTALTYQFKSGEAERIHYIRHQTYDNWVEYPDEEPTLPSGLDTTLEQVLVRKVMEVDAAGVATIEVTFEEVKYSDTRRLQKKVNTGSYSSTPEKTESTNEGEPVLSGESYRIKLSPDSRVVAVLGVDELRAKLGLAEGKGGSIVGLVLTEDRIKDVHERHFMLSGVAAGGVSEALFTVPDVMIRAEAVKKVFEAGPVELEGAGTVVKVKGTGEPVYQRPEGWGQPPKPGDPGRLLIRSESDMQEFKADTEALFSVSDGVCRRDVTNTEAKLILLEDEIFQARQGDKRKSRGGMMITKVKLERTFESLP